MLDFSKFECDKCGACCQSLIVEAGYYDALREPRLFQIGTPPADRDKLRSGEHCVVLHDIETSACPFLDGQTNHCGIYQTRPQCCVGVEAGDVKCQQARMYKDLPPLRDRDGALPTLEMLEQSADEYDLDDGGEVAAYAAGSWPPS